MQNINLKNERTRIFEDEIISPTEYYRSEHTFGLLEILKKTLNSSIKCKKKEKKVEVQLESPE